MTARRPNFKHRAAEALTHLRKAAVVARRDHQREDMIALHDIAVMMSLVDLAIGALRGGDTTVDFEGSPVRWGDLTLQDRKAYMAGGYPY